MDNFLTVQDDQKYMAIMASHEAAIARELGELHAANQSVLDQVQAMVSLVAFQQIKYTLSESGFTHSYLIADSPLGEPQDDDYVLGDVYVDQTTSGGHTGDDYAGTMSMPISSGKYFQFCYAC